MAIEAIATELPAIIQSVARGIHAQLEGLLKVYEQGLIGHGCCSAAKCAQCPLDYSIIADPDEPYAYAGGTLGGTLTICDFLGILKDEWVKQKEAKVGN